MYAEHQNQKAELISGHLRELFGSNGRNVTEWTSVQPIGFAEYKACYADYAEDALIESRLDYQLCKAHFGTYLLHRRIR
jgi:hypothetical protein